MSAMDVAAWLDGLGMRAAERQGSTALDSAPDAPELDDPQTISPELLNELRADLEATAAWCIASVPAAMRPLRLPKSRLADLSRCERMTVAKADAPSFDDDISPARFGGIALDRFVVHQLVAGRVLDPVTELRGALIAEGEWAALDYLDGLSDGEAQVALWPLVGAVTDAWSGIEAEWVPRTQSAAMLALADGAVICSGLLDVEFGGQVAGRPSALVEVKSGKPAQAHADEVYLYALLVSLRDGVAPAEVARWYPGGGPVAVPVSIGMVESAARRLSDSIEQWGSLRAGRPAEERPGWWCRFCPAADECPSARVDLPVDPDELADELAGGFGAAESESEDDDA